MIRNRLQLQFYLYAHDRDLKFGNNCEFVLHQLTEKLLLYSLFTLLLVATITFHSKALVAIEGGTLININNMVSCNNQNSNDRSSFHSRPRWVCRVQSIAHNIPDKCTTKLWKGWRIDWGESQQETTSTGHKKWTAASPCWCVNGTCKWLALCIALKVVDHNNFSNLFCLSLCLPIIPIDISAQWFHIPTLDTLF